MQQASEKTQHVGEEWSRLDGVYTFLTPPTRPARATCEGLALPRVQSDGWGVQAARARSIPTLTAAAHPTEPVAAACTAWDAAAAGGAKAGEPARWDGPYPLPWGGSLSVVSLKATFMDKPD